DSESEHARNFGRDPFHRLLLLACGKRLFIARLAAVNEIHGETAQRDHAMNHAMKRQHATAEDHDYRQKERNGRSEDPCGGDGSTSHRQTISVQFVIRKRENARKRSCRSGFVTNRGAFRLSFAHLLYRVLSLW